MVVEAVAAAAEAAMVVAAVEVAAVARRREQRQHAETQLVPVINALLQPTALLAGTKFENDADARGSFDGPMHTRFSAPNACLYLERSEYGNKTDPVRFSKSPRYDHFSAEWWELID